MRVIITALPRIDHWYIRSRKSKSNRMAVPERQELHKLTQEEKTKQAALDSAIDNLGVAQRKAGKLETEEIKLVERKSNVSWFPSALELASWLIVFAPSAQTESKGKTLQAELTKTKSELAEVQARKVQTA